ncbi:SDR family oxidoreductase [Pontibacter kalidii]|uniref:SDR family oxidoreductase n=1 Tax=Pontibacter kalidii TaxID=2592049 RepID=UPI0022509080|nr:SDR family oxidoreductase [Pontibacter kalidii]
MTTDENKHSGARKGVAVITGASAGLGRACAREFARQGYDVGLLARGVEGLEGAKREVEQMGRRAVYVPVDVADAQAVEDAATRIEQELGEIEVWVNNAMNSVFSPVKEMEPDDYKRVTDVTYLGQVYGTLSALKRMQPRDRGSIVLVGSALAYRGIPLQSAYCGAKHAIQGFYDSLRTELIHDKSNVKITMVQLPAMNTTQFMFVKSRLPNKPRPMGTIFQPEVAAEVIVYAAEHERREYRVGYPTLKAIIGNKIAPWYADLVLARDGFKGQQTDEPEDPNRQNNLYAPLPGDHGAHGTFDDKATYTSPQVWLSLHRQEVLTGALAIGALALGGILSRKWSRDEEDVLNYEI